MLEMYKKVVFENYANFKGRASRNEYWSFYLSSILFFLALIFGAKGIGDLFGILDECLKVGLFICLIYAVIIFIPMLAIMTRRLHDVGKSGWLLFIALIPSIGALILLIFFCSEGNRGENKYGKNPKEVFDELHEIGKE